MCGVLGVINSPAATSPVSAATSVFLGLITLQHRGQDAAGILSYSFEDASAGKQAFHLVKNLGLVESIFSQEAIQDLRGTVAIGHTRYSTVGRGDVFDVQPLMLNYPYGLGLVHNGNIVNYTQTKNRLASEMRRRCLTNSDSETILNWFAHHLEAIDFPSIEKAFRSVVENIHGAYSVAAVVGDGGLVAFRDAYGLRPLVLGEKKSPDGAQTISYMVASETVPLNFLGYEFVRNLEPGEVLYIDRDLKMHSSIYKKEEYRPCMFEWVYFASAESEIELTPVYGARLELGRSLAKIIREKIESGEIEADLVAPVPDTARTAATAIAEELRLPYREILIKNRYIKRTFILGSQEKREKAVDLKLNPVVSEIKGKSVLLVDDSIVRGTTSKKIVNLIRKAGAKKVYFVSTCPPIRFPCFYGLDFPSSKELIAANRNAEEMARELGADAVIYQNIEGLVTSIERQSGGRIRKPCMACLDGKYPTDVTESSRFAALRETERTTEL